AQMAVVEKTLADIGAADKPVFTIFNKIDQYEYEPYDTFSLEPKSKKNWSLDDWKADWRERKGTPGIFISAREKRGINKLKEDLYKMVAEIHAGRYPFNNFLW
ncbi:MAG: GTPase HflX, partial [Bacteroidales bacterium]|nr:GTPase HflX [Bacteroidales bacterium]